MRILPVIMSGGSGTRLWPLSTPNQPKQFHALTTQSTMIQETALRLRGPDFLPPVIICGKGHEALALSQMADVGIQPTAVILEPFARNTAAVAAAAALIAQEIDEQALVLLAPADHLITKPDMFLDAVHLAAPLAHSHIVTFGIRPSAPETGFGYIQRDKMLADGIYVIKRFLEKPDRATAENYVADGNYDWNAGIFLFASHIMLEELKTYEPQVVQSTRKALNKSLSKDNPLIRQLNPEAFSDCPSISIDYAVMEKTRRAAVVPCDIGWADVGNFAELWRLGKKDTSGNHTTGKSVVIDAQNCLIHTENTPVAVIGLDNIMVIATSSGIVVAPLSRAQEISKAAENVKKFNS